MMMVGSTRLLALGVAVRLLSEAAVDLEDPAETDAYFTHARRLMDAVIAAPARTYSEARVKAEAVAWCCGSRTSFGLGQSWAERVTASLLRDLLAIGGA